MIITKEWLAEQNACDDGIALFEKHNIPDSGKWLDLLIHGGDEVEELQNNQRLIWANWLIIRLLSRTDALRYAVFAARQVLGIYENEYPGDARVRDATNAAEARIEDPNNDDLKSAAWDVAWSVERSAGWDAERSAARSAAWAAARSVAWSAVWYAVWPGGWSAERPAGWSAAMVKILEYGDGIITEREDER